MFSQEVFEILIYVYLGFTTFAHMFVPISGSATVTPFLALLTDSHRAVGIASFFFFLSGLIKITLFRKDIVLREVKALLPVSLIGAFLGATLLVAIPPQLLLLILFLFSAYFLYKRVFEKEKKETPETRANLFGSVVGLLSGFLQGAGMAGAELRAGYLYARKLDIMQVQATAPAISAGNFLLASLVLLHAGKLAVGDLTPLAYFFPFMWFGIWMGRKALLKIRGETRDRIVIGLMTFTTVSLAIKILSEVL